MNGEPDHYVLDDGSERWEVDHKLHREDGPALITPEGQFWYRHGNPLPPEEVEARRDAIAAEKNAIEAEVLRLEGDTAAETVKGGTSRPVAAMRPLRFAP
jgi:hypothetical protein